MSATEQGLSKAAGGDAAALLSAPASGRVSAGERAYEEYCRLLEAGTQPDADVFCGRFPSTVQRSLRLLMLAHDWLAGHVPAGAEPGTAPPPAWPPVGDAFLGFVLQRQLGQGAFARVFLAAEPALGDRQVVVKVSRVGAAEARTLGRLDHANIVPVHSVRQDPATGLTAICMPYLGSATLDDVLERAFAGPGRPARARVILEAARAAVPPDAPALERHAPAGVLQRGSYVEGVLHLGARMAEALAFMHGRGVCHQDLKPSNVLLSPDGRPMLLDFNLSRDERADRGLVGGTLPYMSPEQLRAFGPERDQPPPSDARSDVFALGVILYELLTGELPFGPVPLGLSEEELCREMLARQGAGPRPLRAANPDVDRSVARLVERCLVQDPQERPASAAEVAAALRRALKPLPRARRWVARHPWITAAVVLLALGLGMASTLFVALRDPPAVRQYHQGLAAYQEGSYEEAIDHFNEALQADPDMNEALFARGRARMQRGDRESLGLAQDDFTALNNKAPSGESLACMAYAINRKDEDQIAIFFYERAMQMGFAPAEVCNNLAYCYMRFDRRKLTDARLLLDRAIDLNPNLQAAYHNRALLTNKEALAKLTGNNQDLTTGSPNAVRSRQELDACVERAYQDTLKALNVGPASTELCHDAAWVCAVGAHNDPSKWVGPCLKYLAQAVDEGADPARLTADAIFDPLRTDPRFSALVHRPGAPRQPLPATTRLVDPVHDRTP